MRTTRHARRRLCGWLVVALLFMQLAVAAHACAVAATSAPSDGKTVTSAMPACPDHPAEPQAGTPGDDPSQVCKAHCARESQAFGASVTLADIPPVAAVVAVLDWRPVDPMPARAVGSSPGQRSGAPPPGSPPLYLSLLVLRN